MPGPRVVLLGKQGAGNGTQATRVADHYEIAHLATGDIFRSAAREQTPLGVQASRYIDRGELVPDDIVIGVVGEFLQGDDRSIIHAGFVLHALLFTLAGRRRELSPTMWALSGVAAFPAASSAGDVGMTKKMTYVIIVATMKRKRPRRCAG